MSAPRNSEPRPMPPERLELVERLRITTEALAGIINDATWIQEHQRDGAIRDLHRIIRALEQET